MNKTVVNQGGVSGLSLLVLLFIGLKLTGFIEWSWWWVTAPLWIPLALTVSVLAGFGIMLLWIRSRPG